MQLLSTLICQMSGQLSNDTLLNYYSMRGEYQCTRSASFSASLPSIRKSIECALRFNENTIKPLHSLQSCYRLIASKSDLRSASLAVSESGISQSELADVSFGVAFPLQCALRMNEKKRTEIIANNSALKKAVNGQQNGRDCDGTLAVLSECTMRFTDCRLSEARLRLARPRVDCCFGRAMLTMNSLKPMLSISLPFAREFQARINAIALRMVCALACEWAQRAARLRAQRPAASGSLSRSRAIKA